MKIYNLIYCFFYELSENQGRDGRLSAAGIVFFALLMHILLILEIIFDLTGHKIDLFPHYNGAAYSHRKEYNMLLCVPFMIVIWLFYNRNRTERLLKEYQDYYKGDENRASLRFILYVIAPTILALILSSIRHKFGTLNII